MQPVAKENLMPNGEVNKRYFKNLGRQISPLKSLIRLIQKSPTEVLTWHIKQTMTFSGACYGYGQGLPEPTVFQNHRPSGTQSRHYNRSIFCWHGPGVINWWQSICLCWHLSATDVPIMSPHLDTAYGGVLRLHSPTGSRGWAAALNEHHGYTIKWWKA